MQGNSGKRAGLPRRSALLSAPKRFACSAACCLGILAGVLLLIAGPEALCAQERLELQITPYAWLASVEGDITVRGQESSVDASFGDILDDLDLAAMGHVEARYGRWGAFVDPAYMKLSADSSVGPVEADAELEILILEFGGLYRLASWGAGSERLAGLDLLLGSRYWKADLDVDVELPAQGLARDVQGDQGWVDPLVGLRLQLPLSRRFLFNLRGDVGGFGLSDDMSDFSWQALGLLGFAASEHIMLMAGYRALGVDYDTGSGRDRFALDTTIHGPLLGLGIWF